MTTFYSRLFSLIIGISIAFLGARQSFAAINFSSFPTPTFNSVAPESSSSSPTPSSSLTCSSNAQCNDADPCTNDLCTARACVHTIVSGCSATPTPTPSSTTTATPTQLVATDSVTIVVTSSNGAPDQPTISVTEPDYCHSGPAAMVSWTYSDDDNTPAGTDPQSAYQLQITDSASFASSVYDSGKVSGSATSYYVSSLQYNQNYKARVMVWDSSDSPSVWSNASITWQSPSHAYPQVAFGYSPAQPKAKQSTQFTDTTTCYDASNNPIACSSWSWNFGDGGSANTENPSHTYATTGSFTSSVTVGDGTYTCNVANIVPVDRSIPVWREVAP